MSEDDLAATLEASSKQGAVARKQKKLQHIENLAPPSFQVMKFGMYGKSKNRKSGTLATAGFLNLKFADRLPPDIVKMLRSGDMAEITRINVIDTEPYTWSGGLLLQKGRPEMYAMLKPLIEGGWFGNGTLIKMPDGKEIHNLGNIHPVETRGRDFESVETKVEQFNEAFDEMAKDNDEHTMNIVDGLSDHYKIINQKTMMKGNKNILEVGEEALKTMNQKEWAWRNVQWDLVVRLVTQSRSWWGLTFKKVINSKWLQEKHGLPEFKVIMMEGTEYLPQVWCGIETTTEMVGEIYKDVSRIDIEHTAFPTKTGQRSFALGDNRSAFVSLIDKFKFSYDRKDEEWW